MPLDTTEKALSADKKYSTIIIVGILVAVLIIIVVVYVLSGDEEAATAEQTTIASEVVDVFPESNDAGASADNAEAKEKADAEKAKVPLPIGIRAMFHNPSSGYQKAIIKAGDKYVTAIAETAWNYKYSLPVNTWSAGSGGPVVITWNDNTIANNNDGIAETIWIITALDHGTKYRIHNTQHPSVFIGNNSSTNPNGEVGDGPFTSTMYDTAQPDLILEQSGSDWTIKFTDRDGHTQTMYSFTTGYSTGNGGYGHIDWYPRVKTNIGIGETAFSITFV